MIAVRISEPLGLAVVASVVRRVAAKLATDRHADRAVRNLGWKIVSVLQKRCKPTLLNTYSAERQPIAKELIDFDREFAAVLASIHGHGGGTDPAKTQSYHLMSREIARARSSKIS
jgi:hypothetical protein